MIDDLTTATLDVWEHARIMAEARELLHETEKGFQAAIVELAKWAGWKVYHTHDSRRSAPGFPDLVMVRETRLIFVEVKTERGKVSAAQHDWLNALAFTCAEWHIWRPRDWPDIVATLE